MKDKKLYEVGNLLWRTTDNALFEITQINMGLVDLDGKSISSYVLKCVNHMDIAERVTDHEPETELAVNIDMVHAEGSIYTPYQPSKAKKGQHVWNKNIIGRNKEFIVEAVKDIPGSSGQDIPCKSCHNGICEQCRWGYRSEEDIAKEIRASYKKPETIYTMVSPVMLGSFRYVRSNIYAANTAQIQNPLFRHSLPINTVITANGIHAGANRLAPAGIFG